MNRIGQPQPLRSVNTRLQEEPWWWESWANFFTQSHNPWWKHIKYAQVVSQEIILKTLKIWERGLQLCPEVSLPRLLYLQFPKRMIEEIMFFSAVSLIHWQEHSGKKLVLVGVKNAQDLEEFEKGSCWYYKDPSQKIQAALFGCAWVG